jgi:hypothetical protein
VKKFFNIVYLFQHISINHIFHEFSETGKNRVPKHVKNCSNGCQMLLLLMPGYKQFYV